jgi:hypothetical protein
MQESGSGAYGEVTGGTCGALLAPLHDSELRLKVTVMKIFATKSVTVKTCCLTVNRKLRRACAPAELIPSHQSCHGGNHQQGAYIRMKANRRSSERHTAIAKHDKISYSARSDL